MRNVLKALFRCINVQLLLCLQMNLPLMKQKPNSAASVDDGEMLTNYWLVDNMYTFENIGFSNTVGTIKYLICADCEIGPIGWHDIQNKDAFYVSLERVEHRD